MLRIRSLTIALFLVMGAGAGRAADDDAKLQAEAHYRAGEEAYAAKDYDTAIREFESAYRLRPSAVLDYEIALVYAETGKKQEAIAHLQRALQQKPNPSFARKIESRIAVLRGGAAGPITYRARITGNDKLASVEVTAEAACEETDRSKCPQEPGRNLQVAAVDRGGVLFPLGRTDKEGKLVVDLDKIPVSHCFGLLRDHIGMPLKLASPGQVGQRDRARSENSIGEVDLTAYCNGVRERAWQATQAADSVKAYKKFLENFRGGRQEQIANQRIAELLRADEGKGKVAVAKPRSEPPAPAPEPVARTPVKAPPPRPVAHARAPQTESPAASEEAVPAEAPKVAARPRVVRPVTTEASAPRARKGGQCGVAIKDQELDESRRQVTALQRKLVTVLQRRVKDIQAATSQLRSAENDMRRQEEEERRRREEEASRRRAQLEKMAAEARETTARLNAAIDEAQRALNSGEESPKPGE